MTAAVNEHSFAATDGGPAVRSPSLVIEIWFVRHVFVVVFFCCGLAPPDFPKLYCTCPVGGCSKLGRVGNGEGIKSGPRSMLTKQQQ